MRSTLPLFDGLEPRTLCSAGHFRALETSYVACADSPVVDAGIAVLVSTSGSTSGQDGARNAVRGAIDNARANDPTVIAAQAALGAARETARATIDADLAALRAVSAAARPAILADLAAIRAHRNDAAALAADRAQLAADRQRLANDLAPLQATLRTDRQAIVDAEAALRDAIGNNAGVIAARSAARSAGSRLVTEARQLQGGVVRAMNDQTDGQVCVRVGSGIAFAFSV